MTLTFIFVYVKHNRALRAPAAPGLSFTEPNLPLLIHEIEQLITQH